MCVTFGCGMGGRVPYLDERTPSRCMHPEVKWRGLDGGVKDMVSARTCSQEGTPDDWGNRWVVCTYVHAASRLLLLVH